MKPGSVVIYFDTKGEAHNALVTAVNPLDPQEIDLCFASEGGPLPVVMKLAIRHASTKTSGTHCWCEPAEHEVIHVPIPEGTHEDPGEPGTLIVDGTEPKAEAAPGETGTGEQAIGDSNQ